MEDYIVSARKYRPSSFDSVVGQQALTTTLKNTVKSGKLAHAYLFCGPRGVGKTTCARIFAKAINCLSPTSDGDACEHCESCQAFNEQRSLNIIELDAASNNSVENIKALMEQTRIPPQIGKYKVFIIDEVHMLSTAAFNAFLKTLEEPPAHVIFILATTEKHKILPTILSRCQIYDFERMTVNNTIAHLKMVADREGITYEDQALEVIAEKADGGMRDALSIFDQVASFCQGNITYQKVIEDLNVLDSDYYFKIVDYSLENKVSDIMVLVNQIMTRGFDGGQLIAGLAKHVRNVMMAKDAQTLPILEVSDQQRELLKQQAQRCNTRFLYQALQLMNQCDVNYRTSSNKRLLVELTLIEVAQLTQPAEGPSSGRRPRRLKSLFKQLMPQAQPVKKAPQVASVAAAASAPKTVGNMQNGTQTVPTTIQSVAQMANGGEQATARTAATYNATARPRLKTQVGYSWSRLKESEKGKNSVVGEIDMGVQTTASSVSSQEKNAFTQEQLEREWMAMCNRMPQQYSAQATRMKNMRPVITTLPQVEVTVDNELAMEQIQGIRGSIVNTLKLYLHNNAITLDVKLAEISEHERAMTRREQYEEMAKENPAVAKLREMLNLELA